MIYFKKIRWKNFLSTGNQFTEVLLDKSSRTLIIGENGAGKSTILDALTFGLFGKPFRSINKVQLINSVNQAGTLVEIEFSIGSKSYLLRRGIKKNLFEIYLNGELLDQDAKVRDYQEQLEKTILKLNYKSFTQIVILGSSSFVPFMQLRAADRRAIIEDLLDIEVFGIMNQLLRVRIAQNKDDTGTIDIGFGLAKQQKELFEQAIKELKQDKEWQINKNREDIKKHEKVIKDYKNQIEKYTSKNEELFNSIKDEKRIKGEINTFLDYQRSIEKSITKYEKEIEFYEKNEECNTCRQPISENYRKDMIDEFHGKMHEKGVGLVQLGHKLQDHEKRISEIETIQEDIKSNQLEVAKTQNSIQAATEYIAKVNEQIKEIENRTDDIEAKKLDLQNSIEGIEKFTVEKEMLSNQKNMYEAASSLLKDTGIKALVIKKYLPILNKLINKYLASMDFFVSFNLDENFNEIIKSRFRDEFTYDSFSEGEKMRIDLALLFTWRAIAKLKNSANTNLLILDEIFDSSLDANGTEEFMKIISNLTSNSNVFVISHKGDQLSDKFSDIIKFQKHKNFSAIVS